MLVAFYLDTLAGDYARLGELAAASVRRAMPNALIVHLTTINGPQVSWCDGRVAVPAEGNVVYRRAWAHAEVHDIFDGSQVLFMDVDQELRGDVSGMFDDGFHVAIPEIDDPHVRYSCGVVFSRTGRFWKDWAQHLGPDDISTTDVLHKFTRFANSWDGWVRQLPHRLYERLPKSAEDPCDGALLVHYRGPRKAWMLERAAAVRVVTQGPAA